MKRLFLYLAIRFSFFENILMSFVFRFSGRGYNTFIIRELYERKYRVNVGAFTYGGCFHPLFNFGGKSVDIGAYCSIASGVRYLGANHPIDNFSTSAVFYNKSMGMMLLTWNVIACIYLMMFGLV